MKKLDPGSRIKKRSDAQKHAEEPDELLPNVNNAEQRNVSVTAKQTNKKDHMYIWSG